MCDSIFVPSILPERDEVVEAAMYIFSLPLTLPKSSLSLTHGLWSTDDNLTTMLRALLLSPVEAVRKSLVRNVPIPKETTKRLNDETE